jgi:hypothetical protein
LPGTTARWLSLLYGRTSPQRNRHARSSRLLRADDREDEGAVVDALSQYIEQALGSPL